MIFLNALFGYLCIAIVYKWLSAKTTDLYHVMIYMFLSPGQHVEHSAPLGLCRCKQVAVRLAVSWTHASVCCGPVASQRALDDMCWCFLVCVAGNVDEAGYLFAGQAGLQVRWRSDSFTTCAEQHQLANAPCS